jgi:hypothetical protein
MRFILILRTHADCISLVLLEALFSWFKCYLLYNFILDFD